MENPSEKDGKDSNESQVSSPVSTVINAPKFGYVIPNRVFVGGISSQTTENDLAQLFSSYGNVVNTKIIADRAGVSKGYGFVTFETEEEAKRLQADAESIVLRERRLNIAPAIRKQNYQPRTYDGVPGSPVSISPGQLYRQTGVPFFQNGMAFYTAAPAPQPPQPMTPVQSPVEAPQVYPPGAYGGVPQNSTAQNFTFSYPAQSHVYYPAHYPYQLALEGYPVTDVNNVLIPAGGGAENGGVVFAASPYIFTQQPGTQQNAFFDPQNIAQIAPTQEQIFYPASRGYETPTFLYTECKPPQPGTPSGPGTLENKGVGYLKQEAPELPLHTNRENGSAPFASKRGKPFSSRGGYNKPPPRCYLNNNDPNFTDHYPNANLNRKPRPFPTRSYKPTPNRTFNHSSMSKPFLGHPGTSHNKGSPVQVPQFPYLSGVRPPYVMQPISPHFSSPRRGLIRPRYQSGRGKNPKGTGWYKDSNESVTEEGNVLANALTPPITPRSPHDASEDLSASLQGLNI
uniref:Protein boule n=1 Tax=Lygus hesperus TaxID=30085 RepID=A0A0A9WRR8_LYGHE